MSAEIAGRAWDETAIREVLSLRCGRPPAGSCEATFQFEGYVYEGLLAATGDEAVTAGWVYDLGVWQCPAHAGRRPWMPVHDGISRSGDVAVTVVTAQVVTAIAAPATEPAPVSASAIGGSDAETGVLTRALPAIEGDA